jgi:hypothetical protein
MKTPRNTSGLLEARWDNLVWNLWNYTVLWGEENLLQSPPVRLSLEIIRVMNKLDQS